MGCVLGREVSSGIVSESRESKNGSFESDRRVDNVTVPNTDANVVEVENAGTQEEEKADGKTKQRGERRKSKPNPRLSNLPKHLRGEQVAAGWPSWLSDACGEALNGWIPRRADTFEKIDKIGSGTYSNVYKAKDMVTNNIVALKKVRFDNLEPESVKFMAREILILRRLDHPNVVKLEGLVTSRMSCSLYLVFQYMEHDLAGLVASPIVKFTEPQVKCYIHQLLSGLEHCHNRGVLHRDIKGSNLLIDDEGVLKIADFGLATFFDPNRKHLMTSRVVTLWYRAPELLLGATDYGVGVDLWSAGCILAELFAGRPVMPGRTEVEQLHKIYKLCGSPSDEYWKKYKLPNATLFKPREPYKRCIKETFKDFPPLPPFPPPISYSHAIPIPISHSTVPSSHFPFPSPLFHRALLPFPIPISPLPPCPPPISHSHAIPIPISHSHSHSHSHFPFPFPLSTILTAVAATTETATRV